MRNRMDRSDQTVGSHFPGKMNTLRKTQKQRVLINIENIFRNDARRNHMFRL